MTRVAILEPASGIAGDMMLGALLDLGVEPAWLHALPAALGLDGVVVHTTRVQRAGIAAWKVDFEIPPQPHGRHLKHIKAIVDASAAPERVRERANHTFELLTAAEAAVHGTTVEKVHLHEVGAVDAILDVVGSVWGLDLLGVEAVRCGVIALGDGFVDAAHGRMAVPAPAVVRLVEGFDVAHGPPDSGELTTPTGAALMRALATPGVPATYRPVRTGFGAGTKDFAGRANVLRVTLAEVSEASSGGEQAVVIACDVDDMSGEYLAGAADALRAAGALDVTLLPIIMKKGRPGTRVEVICRPSDAKALEERLLVATTTIGVRRSVVDRTELSRRVHDSAAFGHPVRVKVVHLPDGSTRAKPEFDDVMLVAAATGRPPEDVRAEALRNLSS
jgi:uncharacterized protein (TIGR00299 family) protein